MTTTKRRTNLNDLSLSGLIDRAGEKGVKAREAFDVYDQAKRDDLDKAEKLWHDWNDECAVRDDLYRRVRDRMLEADEPISRGVQYFARCHPSATHGGYVVNLYDYEGMLVA